MDWSKFGTNYSAKIPLDGVGCELSRIAPAGFGQMLVGNQLSLPCDYYVQQRNAQDQGYNAFLGGTPLSQFLANYLTVPGPYQNGIPIVYSGYPSTASLGDQINFPASLVALSLISKGLNITIRLDFPALEPLYESTTVITGSLYNIRWIGFSYAVFALVLCSSKLAIFVTAAGKLELNIPQLVLFCCALGSIFVIMDGIWVVFGFYETASNLGGKFFEYWCFSWSVSACVVVGFYFKEISSLTSSTSMKFLDKLFIPFIGIIVLLWASQIVISFLNTFPPAVGATSVTAGFGNLFISVIAFVDACTLAIVAWGSVSLLLTIGGIGSERKTIIITTIVLTCFATAVSVAFSITYLAIRYFPATTAGAGLTAVNWTALGLGILLFAPTTVFVIFGFMFRISVSKEVEISKSATSSTSYSSQSTSASSSSSKGEEPVIEL